MGQIRLATLTKLQKNVEKVSTTPKKQKKNWVLGGIYRCALEAWPFLSFHFIFGPTVFSTHINGPTSHFGQTNCRLLDGFWDTVRVSKKPFAPCFLAVTRDLHEQKIFKNSQISMEKMAFNCNSRNVKHFRVRCREAVPPVTVPDPDSESESKSDEISPTCVSRTRPQKFFFLSPTGGPLSYGNIAHKALSVFCLVAT